MSEEKNRWIDAIAKMIQLTQDGILKWKASVPPAASQKTDDLVEIVFETRFKDKDLRLYKRTYKGYRPVEKSTFEMMRSLPSLMLGEKQDVEPYWDTEVKLEFLSRQGRPIWTYPEISILDDLLSSVQYQVAGVKDFINDLLNNEEATNT